MDALLKELENHLRDYRAAVDQLFSEEPITARDWRERFLEILISASRLYLDYLEFIRHRLALEATSIRARSDEIPKSDFVRERSLRDRLWERLESWLGWNGFEPRNAFSDFTGLRNLDDYIKAFALHLPEIYEESIRVQECAAGFLSNRSSASLVWMETGLQHMARNHIPFVQQALEGVADEDRWNDS